MAGGMSLLRLGAYLLGSVRLRVEGRMPERFINLCATNRFPLWDVRWHEGAVDCTLPLPHFFRLRPLLRKSGCRARVVARLGLPFAWRRLRRRRVLLTAGLAVLVALYVFSSFIWFFEVRGNEILSDRQILAEAARAGLRPGVWRPGLNRDAIARDMILGLPALSWVSIRFVGTKAIIEVVEKVLPPEETATGPGDLIAERAGLVEDVLVLQGEAAVEPGDIVLPGQVLIRGVISAPPPSAQFPAPGEQPPATQFKPVRARGRVIARTWREGYLELPLVERIATPTGRTMVQRRLAIGEREFIIYGPRRPPFEHYRVDRRIVPLPPWTEGDTAFRLIADTYTEIDYTEHRRNPQEALREAQRRLRARLLGDVDADARIEAIESQVIDAGQGIVALRMTIEVREDITRFLPAEPQPVEGT